MKGRDKVPLFVLLLCFVCQGCDQRVYKEHIIMDYYVYPDLILSLTEEHGISCSFQASEGNTLGMEKDLYEAVSRENNDYFCKEVLYWNGYVAVYPNLIGFEITCSEDIDNEHMSGMLLNDLMEIRYLGLGYYLDSGNYDALVNNDYDYLSWKDLDNVTERDLKVLAVNPSPMFRFKENVTLNTGVELTITMVYSTGEKRSGRIVFN